ncbi:alpha/beta-hydrolase [Rhodocollybia butyracea]|uniref:Alpha/beta-hydrolase n=1 Tax=Rhodocollybia butyracea TaxID=206335 RepID=A0A9P5Q1E0_9AGAR|nr:alpha/beta-hydrolase [Rhodocollybia butyracea]
MTELRTLFDAETCTRKGLCPVTEIRNKNPFESHSLYYEQHGTGPEKILFIMGMNSSLFAWLPQVKYFSRQPQYSVLVFDNRGVGNSSTPSRGPYTTSGMAEDAIVLLNYIGWTEPRSVHCVGLSLGGMIAQELAARIPERLASLSLGVTTPGGYIWTNFPPWKGLKAIIKLTFTRDPADRIPILLDLLYTSSWLEEKALDDPQGRTNRQVETEGYARRFAFTRPQTLLGALSQQGAGLTHHVSADRLRQISKSIPKVALATGDEDHLVYTHNTVYLKKQMVEAEVVEFKNTGHAIHYQRYREFNAMLERVFKEGRERSLVENSS